MKKVIGENRFFLVLLVLFLVGFFSGICVKAQGLTANPNVTWTGDGQAFTTDRGEKDYEIYPLNSSVKTGGESQLLSLEEGEHYYSAKKAGKITISRWTVKKSPGMCIHDSYGVQNGWHGLDFTTRKCGKSFKCGWVGECAECKQEIPILFYMDRDTAKSIDSLIAEKDYYYLCPQCRNLEQGRPIQHDCKQISKNKYFVEYDKNHQAANGYMEQSIFYYDNAGVYEGNRVTGERRLRKNAYLLNGYTFQGWNTKKDGSGLWFEDGQEVSNLCKTDKETLTLFAIWEMCNSTLEVDPGEGAYNGNRGITEITRPYGSMITLATKNVTAPKGSTVTFEGNGGEKVPSMIAQMHLEDWEIIGELNGMLTGNKYYFVGENGAVDRVRARYAMEAIILPKPTRAGYSFGGWYEDTKYARLAGMDGDEYIPKKNCTLYAKWVNLTLYSTPNYVAFSGKGAVDLRWYQKDEKQKVYALYQSVDGKNFSQISEDGELMDEENQETSYGYSGQAVKHKITDTGFYQLIAYGAQGENCEGKLGGKGGEVRGNFYLNRGDVLTIKVGGRAGYNGGGKGTLWGSGGGSTTVVSAQKGILMIAGGGGGATPGTNGGPGGKETGLRTDGISSGQKGEAGGGGGKIGGKAGVYTVHIHDESCFETTPISRDELSKPKGSYSARVFNMHTMDDTINPAGGDRKIGGHNVGNDGSPCRSNMLCEGIPAKGYDTISMIIEMCAEGGNQGAFLADNKSLMLTLNDQNGNAFYTVTKGEVKVIADANTTDTDFGTKKRQYDNAKESVTFSYRNPETTAVSQYIKFVVKVALPKGTTSVGFSALCITNNKLFHYQSQDLQKIVLEGEKQVQVCPYDDGQVLANKQSYGGSSFVETEAVGAKCTADTRKGDGEVQVKLLLGGTNEEMSKEGVLAMDCESPRAVEEGAIKKEALTESLLKISWSKPSDFGTGYYHQVESHSAINGEKICASNVTWDEIITGVKGYYYVLDTRKGTVVTADNGIYTGKHSLENQLTAKTQYFHIAAVDRAGNISETTHISCGLLDDQIFWKPRTSQIQISSVLGETDYKSVWQKEEKVYYVKADGLTPFQAAFQARLDGAARENYQADQMIYHTLLEDTQEILLGVPRGDVASQTQDISAESISISVSQKDPLKPVAFREAQRREKARSLYVAQGFSIDSAWNGREMILSPSAGATGTSQIYYSNAEEDQANAVKLIADGEAPLIFGTEEFERIMGELSLEEYIDTGLNFRAEDALSGVASFIITLTRKDDYSVIRMEADENGIISFCLGEDFPDWKDDFSMELVAIDHVGNEAKKVYEFGGCGVAASLQRILEPHDPVFKCGESGILHIESWGNVEKVRVIFPKELTDKNPELNHEYIYEVPQWRKTEDLQFMIPLYTESAEDYEVIVIAYKSGTNLDSRPAICRFAVTDSVLDELRTRLR